VALPIEPELLSCVLGREGDDATVAVAVLEALAEALGLAGLRLDQSTVPAGLHPTRSATVLDRASGAVLGAVGEVDPGLVAALAPGAAGRRIAWLELELRAVLDEERATRRDAVAKLPSRFPSSDVDLALVLADEVPADLLLEAVATGAGELLEELRLFDVYRGPGLPVQSRSLAVRARLCAEDRTLSDAELAEARLAMIGAAEVIGATLR
jgi:phenylalanyl-tRNA synthetase beta chain